MSDFNEKSDEAKYKANKSFNQQKENTESLAHQIREEAEHLYEEGKKTINDLDDTICNYTEELINKVKEKPLTSLLIAGGIGFLVSHLLKK
ncbi:MAG: DUF883 domain-containing protein [Legionella sp.]|uniref:DUF883 domain-containing protein n=1 Tax=Legionella sp. TaxID=459 RepID=UPI0039E2E2F7